MFSRRSFQRSVSMVVMAQFLWLAACSVFLDEKRQEPQTIEMSNAKFVCLQSLPEELSKFIEGQVSNEGIHRGFKCAQDALIYFKDKTKGSKADRYTMEELRNFFGKYFLKKNNVTPAFASELFKLKKVFLGGSERFITKGEIQRLVELLELLKEQAIVVAPHMTTLVGQRKDPTWKDLDLATQRLHASLLLILKGVDLVNSDYSFADLKKFMDGLEDFISVTEPFYLTEKVSGSVPLVEAVKNVLIGETARLDSLQDWQVSLKTGMLMYKEALRYRYFLQDADIDSPAKVQALTLIANDGLQLLEESLSMQHQGSISFSSIDVLLDQLENRKLLPLGLSARAVKDIYKKVVLRILDPRRRGDSRGLLALERTHLMALKHELKIYQLHQNFIDELKFDRNASVSVPQLKTAAKTYSASRFIENTLRVDSLEQDSLEESWQEGLLLLLKDRPVIFDRLGREIVSGTPQSYLQTWGSLTRWNVMRALTRFLLLGYGQRKSSQMPLEEMIQPGLELWYKDFNLIGTELKAFDPRSANAGARSFKEANFFTYYGNGDSVMNFHETFDFVSLLVSGGMISSENLRQDILTTAMSGEPAKNCVLKDEDIFGYPLFKEICFKTNLRKNFGAYFGNLPGMVRQVQTMTEKEWNDFYFNLFSAARVSAPAGGLIETADIRTAVMMLHYVESLMSVYDLDQSGKLNIEELRRAAPRFLLFMKQVSPVDANFMVTDFFLFLVFKGQKPNLLDYSYFQGEKAFGSLEDAGRDKILRVFKVLKDEAAAE